MTNSEIIELARSFKTYWHTSDPYKIADKLGIQVLFRKTPIQEFTAQIVKIEGYPTIIAINDEYTDFSKKLLCAHELGHALLHENCVNHFASTPGNVATNVEPEANLFALALLSDEMLDRKLNISLGSMNGYLLKFIMEYNLRKK